MPDLKMNCIFYGLKLTINVMLFYKSPNISVFKLVYERIIVFSTKILTNSLA